MDLQSRIDNYVKQTKYPNTMYIGEDGRLYGCWIMGQNYRVKSKYYGGYPHTYLERIKALFPDKKNVLHVFAGMVDTGTLPGDTVDINPDLVPTYVDNAQTLERVPVENYDLFLCDPPYSEDDARKYGTTLCKRNKVISAISKRAKPGSHIVWLDQVLPQYRKDLIKPVGFISMIKSTNHRFRVVVIYEKQ